MQLLVLGIDIPGCGRQNSAPPSVCAPTPETRERVTCHGKRDFAEVFTLRIVRQREHPGLHQGGGAQCHHKAPSKREAGASEAEKGGVTTEAAATAMRLEDRGRAHQPRSAVTSSSWERPAHRFCPRVSKRSTALRTPGP